MGPYELQAKEELLIQFDTKMSQLKQAHMDELARVRLEYEEQNLRVRLVNSTYLIGVVGPADVLLVLCMAFRTSVASDYCALHRSIFVVV